mmetsp:Transcript_13324/g.25006  ORF Transcript_13324/g.25006 Transcript_13324/m.25006 type:complete len:158 (-) Transcript_13324:41-514(-)
MFFQESSSTTEESCDVVAKAIQYAQEDLNAAKSSGDISSVSSSSKLVSIEQNPDKAIDSPCHLPVIEKQEHLKPSPHLPIHEWAKKFPELQLADRLDVQKFKDTNGDKKARIEGNHYICEFKEHAALRKTLKEQIKKELLEIHQGKKMKQRIKPAKI